ncbi:MAG: hypothetical protein JWO99_768 [Candidatus Saccharibacteria bacterium]|nr:hypothetical protein [Candidatus Saccharibacteria bacterium]
MKKAIIIVIIAIVVIGGGTVAALMLSKPASKTTDTPTTTTSSSNQSTNTNSTPTTSGTTQSITVVANDGSASPDTINVTKGDTVNLTFTVSSAGTYHGGLDFKSSDPAIDSGGIAQGDSKTISFTATKSFKFTPFWYQSNIQKDYFVTVNVQ